MPIAKPAWPILQRADPLSVGLVVGLPFYEGSGGTTNDLSGKGNKASFTGTWAGGPFGSVVSTDGATTEVNIPNSTSLNIQAGDLTVSVWFFANTLSSYTALFDKGTAGVRDLSLFLNASGGAGNVYWNLGDGAGTDGIPLAKTITTGNWWHLAVVRRGSVSSFYVNGIPGSNDSSQTATASGGGNLSLGLNPTGGGAKFNGSYASFHLYNRALSAAEIGQLYYDPFSIYRPKRRVPWFTVAGGAGTQNLAPALFSNTNTFFAPTITVGAVSLTPSLFTDPDTFFGPTVTPGTVALTPGLFTDPDTFYSPTIAAAGAQALAPPLFTNQGIFYLPVVRSHIVLVNVWVRLKEPHEFNARVYPKDTVFGPDQATVPSDFAYTPLMEGLSGDSQAAIAQVKIDVWGRYDSHGNLLDNPPLARPIWDPQPAPVVGNKHFLPLGNGTWP